MRPRHPPQNLVMVLLSLAVWWETSVGAVALRGDDPRVDQSYVTILWFAFASPGGHEHEP
jgi:hypothetical protein